jgi:hypothetical protein
LNGDLTPIGSANHEGLVKELSPCTIEDHDAGLTDLMSGYDEATAIDQIDIGNGRVAHNNR